MLLGTLARGIDGATLRETGRTAGSRRAGRDRSGHQTSRAPAASMCGGLRVACSWPRTLPDWRGTFATPSARALVGMSTPLGEDALCSAFRLGSEKMASRSDDRLFSPFHLWLSGFDSNENRYDQLTVTGFGRQWQLADAADAVEALVAKGTSAGIMLDPVPLRYPRAAFAANFLNFARTNLVDQFPRRPCGPIQTGSCVAFTARISS